MSQPKTRRILAALIPSGLSFFQLLTSLWVDAGVRIDDNGIW